MKVVAILQARIASTRLPGKIMLPLGGRPMIEQIYLRVKRATNLDRVIVAIPKGTWNAMRDAYIPFNDFFLYDGDENDLVGRYLACVTQHQADIVVRIPCDNPCVDPDYIDDAVRRYLTTPSIFFSNTTDYVGATAVDGIGAEVFSVSRLRWLDQRVGDRADWREHPHRYFEAHGLYTLPTADLRLDVNTQEDYEYIRDLYDQMGSSDFSSQQAVNYLLTQEAQHEGIQSSGSVDRGPRPERTRL